MNGAIAYLVGIGLTFVGLALWRCHGLAKRDLKFHPAEGLAMAILASTWPLTIILGLLAWVTDWALRTISRVSR